MRAPAERVGFGAAAFVSGAAALVYEVLWVRRLGEVFGSTAAAVNVVLALFFAGLGVGAYVFGRRAEASRSPARLYAGLEAVIAVCGLLFLPASAAVESAYTSLLPAEWSAGAALAAKALGAVLLLGLPALAMGGTLPVLLRVVRPSADRLGGDLGRLYGWNTLGGALGAVACVFWLLPKLGMAECGAVAAAGNALSALLVGALARGAPPGVEGASRVEAGRGASPWTAWLAAGAAGF